MDFGTPAVLFAVQLIINVPLAGPALCSCGSSFHLYFTCIGYVELGNYTCYSKRCTGRYYGGIIC